MEKLLTVSVAAYNMEKYLRQTLESMALPEIVDRLEVFVVDDGGRDASLDIAREYEAHFPGSFHAVHKANGGYGSTINWSLAHATGRYFRPLDGDDWFDRDGLLRLMDALETAGADAVYTPHVSVEFDGDAERSKLVKGGIMTATSFAELRDPLQLSMHRVTYRTDVLRAAGLNLPERILYTDSIYVCAPFAAARTILPLDFPLYCHRVGRDEQSISSAVRARHLDDSFRVGVALAECCRAQRASGGPNLGLMEEYTAFLNRGTLRLFLRAAPDGEYIPRLRRYDAEIRALSPEVYADAGRRGKMGRVVRLLRASGYRLARPLRPLILRLMRNYP